MDNGEDKSPAHDREHGDRQIKEGAIQPVDDPKGPPPSKVEVVKTDDPPASEPDAGGDSGDGDAERGED